MRWASLVGRPWSGVLGRASLVGRWESGVGRGENEAAADERGLETIDGLDMLIGQAALAFELFFDAEPPREQDDELRDLLTA